MRYFDNEAWEIVQNNINLTIPWYLMASYAYYVEDSPILSDAAFDTIANFTCKKWDEIEHWHKDYLTYEDTKANTFLGTYPQRTIHALHHLRRYGVKPLTDG